MRKKLNLQIKRGMSDIKKKLQERYKGRRNVPELEIPDSDYKPYLKYDEHRDVDSLEIPVDVLLDWIESDRAVKEEVAEHFLSLDYVDEVTARSLNDDLGIKEQPEVWKMNASTFRQHLCEIMELSYHSTNSEILQVISEKLEGLR